MQGERPCDEGANFAALDVGDQVLEDLILLKGATEQRQVLEVQRPYVQLGPAGRRSRRPSHNARRAGARRGAAARMLRQRDRRPRRCARWPVARSAFRSTTSSAPTARSIGLLGARDGDDVGASAFRKLNRGRSDPAEAPVTSTRSRPHRGPVEQVLGRGVCARDRSQLRVGPVALDLVRFAGGRPGVLRKRAVAFRSRRSGHSNGRPSASRIMLRTITRSPMRLRSTPSPAATIRPQQSAPWMRGKCSGTPIQLASASLVVSKPSAPPVPVASPTVFEYHPMRVLTSVLLTPAAATLTSTSPARATRRGDVVAVVELLQSAMADKLDGGHPRWNRRGHISTPGSGVARR